MFRINSSMAGLIFSLILVLLVVLMVGDIIDNLNEYTASLTQEVSR